MVKLLSEQELAELLGVSRRTVRRWHATGKLPRAKRISDRRVRWPQDVIDRWVNKRPPA